MAATQDTFALSNQKSALRIKAQLQSFENQEFKAIFKESVFENIENELIDFFMLFEQHLGREIDIAMDFNPLFLPQANVIAQFIDIMGSDILQYLRHALESGIPNLNNFFNELDPFPSDMTKELASLYKENRLSNKKIISEFIWHLSSLMRKAYYAYFPDPNYINSFKGILNSFKNNKSKSLDSLLIEIHLEIKTWGRPNEVKPTQLKLRKQWGDFSENTKRTFIKILNSLRKSNGAENGIATLLFARIPLIFQHVEIMGDDALIQFMLALTDGIAGFERFCDQFYLLPQDIVEKTAALYQFMGISSKRDKKEFHEFILELGTSLCDERLSAEQKKTLNTVLDTSTQYSFKHRREQLSILLLDIMFLKDVSSDKKVLLIEKVRKLGPNKFGKLILGSRAMSEDTYKEIYFHLLELFLIDETGQLADNFLHDLNQQNFLPKSLATHNQKIQSSLEAAKIVNWQDKSSATRYKKQLFFIVGDDSPEANLEQRKKELFNRLFQGEGRRFSESILDLCNILKENQEKESDDMLWKIRKKLVNIFSLCQRTKTLNLEKMKELIKELDSFEKEIGHKNFNENLKLQNALRSYFEFKDHFMDVHTNYNLVCTKLEELDKQDGKNPEPQQGKTYYFRVEQFSKYRVETLFLGNDVGCCLGLGSPQFQAMIQRILDDAILFHVAIDEKTGRPIALIWLYFAKCTDDSIALVANFFEINGNYAEEPVIKAGLLKGLLMFTHQYCLDNNIGRFYMNELNYGEYKGSLDIYPVTQITLKDKLGGPYIPTEHLAYDIKSEQDNDSAIKTNNFYYLKSLSRTQFHVFSADKLEQMDVPKFKIVEKTISVNQSALSSEKDSVLIHSAPSSNSAALLCSTGMFSEKTNSEVDIRGSNLNIALYRPTQG